MGRAYRVKICNAPDCGLVFYDHSRSRTSRWCSMDTCGNRVKTRRYRQRDRCADAPDAQLPPRLLTAPAWVMAGSWRRFASPDSSRPATHEKRFRWSEGVSAEGLEPSRTEVHTALNC